ncbi:MAG: hypothetical protein PVJ02_15220 [Gemmatimonadota bacterium]|jgi:hypothetical protein
MSTALKYAATGTAVVALVTLVLWPVLGSDARRGVVTAAAIALPIQILAFALLIRVRGKLNGFLAVWAGGTLVRIAVLGIVAVVAIRANAPGTIALLFALAGFFFVLLLLEPVYFRPRAGETT